MFDGWLPGSGAIAVASLRILAILVVAWIAYNVVTRAVRVLRMGIASRLDDPEAVKRAETLGRVIRYLVTVVISLVAGMLVLSEMGISVAPILGAAGVAGLAVGFGAQSLVKDFFTGFFLLLENQIRQGDVVRLGNHSGVVENLTLRYVQLRDYEGNVHFVPNGNITTVVNMSRGFAQAVIDIGIAYGEQVDRVMDVMCEVGEQLAADPAYAPKLLGGFELAGVDKWADSAVMIRGRFKTVPLEQWSVRREYLRRLKNEFDARGIEIPFPQLTVHAGRAPDEPRAAFPVRMSRESVGGGQAGAV
ncbi:MAG TPA: mechanosensitive ion channel family protein [Quisquiliibacterium sp.]|nr:mechanosensitive ion channel family protein [Quisquiliibacterium sp.]